MIFRFFKWLSNVFPGTDLNLVRKEYDLYLKLLEENQNEGA